MTHWQNFYHDATAEELDDFTVEADYAACSSFADSNRFYDMLDGLIIRANLYGWEISRTEIASDRTWYKWRFRLRPARS
jgi:hypothetical protein